MSTTKKRATGCVDFARRAFEEFLTLPTIVVVVFFVLALASYAVDSRRPASLEGLRSFLSRHVFTEPKATSDLLSAIAGGVITVTSITITVLLIAVQQTAGMMTGQVYDQFLRRRHNQFCFGFFIGLSLQTLATLATVKASLNPVLGATLVLVLTTAALYLLLLLLYTSINQMRPVEIVETIHDLVLASREHQKDLIRRTRRSPTVAAGIKAVVRSASHGYVSRIDLATVGSMLERSGPELEIQLRVSIGSFVAVQDVIAEVRAPSTSNRAGLEECIVRAVRLERQRDIAFDTAYGIEQLGTIAWTSISTSKSNPAPGLLTIRILRALLARWSAEEEAVEVATLPLVYEDPVLEELMATVETLAIVSSESMQHQCFAEVIITFSTMFTRLSDKLQARVEDITLRLLSALGDFVLTAELERALKTFAEVLEASSRGETARAVRRATEKLGRSVGALHSRGTRTSS